MRDSVNRASSQSIGLQSVIFAPFRWTFGICWSLLRFTLDLASKFLVIIFGARPKIEPVEAANMFIADFKQKYGLECPSFFAGSYMHAAAKAKRDLSYFLAVLHSPEHDDTDAFCRGVLANPRFIAFLEDKNIVIWAGSIERDEAYNGLLF